MTSRYNVWNLLTKSFIAGMSNFGASQLEAQRMLSFRTLDRARSALLWSIIPTAGLMFLCCTFGLLLFSIFFDCDPLMDGAYTGVQKYDQVLPYYIVSRFSEIPGLTGICIAGIFSGSLSSISSALNSLSTVTVLDFIKPLFPHEQFTEQKTVYLAKALTLVYGGICIGFSFVIANADSIHAVAAALNSVLEGPVIAIFLLGVLTRKGTQKCVLFSLLLGVLLSSWMGYGYVFGGRHDPSLPVNTDGCSDNPHDNFQVQNPTSIWNSTLAPPLQNHQNDAFKLSRVSFNWISFVGMCATSMFVFIGILITGWNHNVIPADSKCLSPVTKLWRKTSQDESTEKLTGEPRALPEIINLNFNTNDIREKNRINNIN